MLSIKDNLHQIKLQISNACQTAGRLNSDVTLLAVSKKKPAQLISEAYQAGQKHFGESYVQEAVEKIAALKAHSDITWHFIGPIQSNKTQAIADNFTWVHSVDRLKIAKRLNEQSANNNNSLNICLQINISNENSKSGVTVNELSELAEFVNNCEHLNLRGLMAIPEKNASQKAFKQMHDLFLHYQQQYPSIDTLSMGMSADMTDAICEGSTMVRVGTAIFGQRETAQS